MNRIIVVLLTWLAVAPAAADSPLANELALAERWLAAQRAYDRVPGLSAAIVHDQELLWSGASGYADLGSKRPASDDTIYGICSISKLFTGIAVMQLRDQGKVRLDDPVNELLPWYNLSQAYEGSPAITLESLLSHSSGLPRESDTPYWNGPDFAFPSREQIRSMLGGQSTLYPAQRHYQYSNLGLTLVGEIVSEISGEEYDGYVQARILKPLALADTATGFPTDSRASRIATGYGYAGRAGEPPPMPRYDTRGITPAAGFASTALDLARFASWQFRLLGGESDEVLNGNTLREMQRVHWMENDWSVARGLAFGVYRVGDRTLTGHAGDCPGFNTRLFLDPVSKYAVITLANRNLSDVDGYAAAVFDILEAGGTPAAGQEKLPASSAGLDDYVGSYDGRPWFGEDLVFRWKDALAIVSMPTKQPIEDLIQLKRVEGDRFQTVLSNGQAGYEVVFTRDDSGQVTQ
ncbi:MAG TPA: serine hydrolase, partial [Xanthomonadales bacterium]|nr:serine hydrolase [Xanthomonadales bacterium]